MAKTLEGRRVAALVTDGFEQSELESPVAALRDAGATVDIISPKAGRVRGWSGGDWGDEVSVDCSLCDASPDDYDAVLLPGGVMNPDTLRTDSKAVAFVREAWDSGKPIAAICHGPWTLIDAGIVDGLTVTSWPSLETDLRNAGANWVDQEVVVDRGVVSSRNPDDLPAFNAKLIEEVAEGRHARGAEPEGKAS